MKLIPWILARTLPAWARWEIKTSGTSQDLGSVHSATLRSLRMSAAFFALLASVTAFGERRVTGISFRDIEGRSIEFPLLGGQSRTLHQLVDIDQDGDLDLFLQVEQGQLIFMENAGTAKKPEFRLNPKPAWAVRDFGPWFYFVDLDGDGDFDLVRGWEATSAAILWNQGRPGSPNFLPPQGPVRDESGDPLSIEALDHIEAADIDCDGDMDLFSVTVLGEIRFWESSGSGSGFRGFKKPQNQYLNLHPTEDHPSPLPKTKKAYHGSRNEVVFTDLDKDGDLDLVWGDFYDSDLVFLRNTGSCREPRFTFPARPLAKGLIHSGGANLPRFGDLDGDGDLDLIVSTLDGARISPSGKGHELIFLRRTGGDIDPVYETARELLPTVDVGSFSAPALADPDGDGDLDLFITNQIDTGQVLTSGLYFFRNTGTVRTPEFQAERQEFLRLRPDMIVSLAFGDLDADGDPDLISGCFPGTLDLYLNQGTRTRPDFKHQDSAYMDIDVGHRSRPTLGDLDGDGDLDLLVGEARGLIQFFRNTGTPRSPRFILEEKRFQTIACSLACAISLQDLDGDSDLDLIQGGTSPEMQVRMNIGTRQAARFDSASVLETPSYFSPTPGDIDGDGDVDLFGGSHAGGLVYYENTGAFPYFASSILPSGRHRPFVKSLPAKKFSNFGLTILLPNGHVLDLLGRPAGKPRAEKAGKL